MIDLTPESKRLREQYDKLKFEFVELFQQKDYMLSFEENFLQYCLTKNPVSVEEKSIRIQGDHKKADPFSRPAFDLY